jgi:hypothetical protein
LLVLVLTFVVGQTQSLSGATQTARAATGMLVLANLNALPRVVLFGNNPKGIVLTALNSKLSAPTDWTAGSVGLRLGAFPESQVCNTFAAADIKPGAPANLGMPSLEAGVADVTLGIGPAQESPFMTLLRTNGSAGFTVTERLGQVTLFLRVLDVPCAPWCWTPLEGAPAASDVYAIALMPSPLCPWTRAVLNFGQWHSELPGATTDDGITFDLRTASGCAINVNSGTFVVGAPGDTCTLGLSCLTWNSACAVDLSGWRFGLSNVAIGRIVRNSSTYVFA